MSSKSRSKLEKRKRREKKLRRERNLRRNQPQRSIDDGELDVDAALEELPTALHIERVMRRIARATGKRRFASDGEILQDVEALGQPGNERALAEFKREDRLDVAQDLAYLALDRENVGFTRDLVADALEVDPECVDALAIVAAYDGETAEERISGLERAIAVAERALGGPAFFAENRGHFWSDVLTRPYMRARRMLAHARRLHGDLRVAADHFEALLELDPSDSIEIRDALIGILLQLGDVDRARTLIEASHAIDSPVAPWASVLERWLAGDLAGAARKLRSARARNRLVEGALIDPTSLDEREHLLELDEDLAALDSDEAEEAEHVVVRVGRAWNAHPDALAWLKSGGPESTEAERRAAIESFSPPVSSLFELGTIDYEKEWPDYSRTCALSVGDVPELIRMATHPVLHEIETEPHEWAVAHAWRALGQLRAEAAIAPLLALAADRRDDDGFLYDLPQVLAEIGPAALPRVIEWMKEHDGDELVTTVGYEAIHEIVGENRVSRARALEFLSEELDRCAERDSEVNAWLIVALTELRAVELAPRIRRAFDECEIDPDIAGDWDAVRTALGVDDGE